MAATLRRIFMIRGGGEFCVVHMLRCLQKVISPIR